LENRTKLILGIIVVFLIGGFLYFYEAGSEDNRPLLAEVMEKVKVAEAPINEYDVNFKKDIDSDRVASVWILIEDTGRDFYRISLQIWHKEETTLNALTLDFSNVEPASALMLTTPEGYPAPPLEFHSIEPASKGVTLSVEDFGPLGTGSVNFEFYLNAVGLKPLPENVLDLDISMKLRENGDSGSTYLITEVPIHIKLP